MVQGVLAVALSCMAALCSAQTTILDDAGVRVTVHAPVRRIISLAPHVTELLYAAGAGPYVVATVEYSDFPEPARTLPRIGNSSALDIERIVSLRPDLVVGWQSGNPAAIAEKLRALGLNVFMSEPETLDTIPENIEKLGWLAGTENIAQLVAGEYREQLKKLRTFYRSRSRLRVFYQISYEPIYTINERHMISQVLALCGGDNVFTGLIPIAPLVSVEAVLKANPQVIIGAHYEQDAPPWRAQWHQWRGMDAARYGNIFYLHPDIIARQTPRILAGVESICNFLDQARAHIASVDRHN